MAATQLMTTEQIRADFPTLRRQFNGRPVVFLDSGASSLKPKQVIQAEEDFYANHYANVHRGIYQLSEEATDLFEGARERVAAFIGAPESRELVLTRGTTEGLNLLAYSLGAQLAPGDEVVSTVMEHHSNQVPWQLLGRRRKTVLKHIGLDDEGYLKMEDLDRLVTDRTKIVTVTHVSNVLGTVNPIREIAEAAHDHGAVCIVDGAQSTPHMPVDVKALGCDFFAFSGHKMLGPTGVGGLWGRAELLEGMEPFLGGGDMISEVHLQESKWNQIPAKFEAGTPHIAGVIGLGAAVDYLSRIGMDWVQHHDEQLIARAMARFAQMGDVRLLGPKDPRRHAGVLAFWLDYAHPHDVAQVFDDSAVCVRAGHHCAMPVNERYGVPATTRASVYLYNDEGDIDRMFEAIEKVRRLFKP
ncbi:MAG TPA: cysteine desulfurase [Candidatus Thermoplasmatota archaeon]